MRSACVLCLTHSIKKSASMGPRVSLPFSMCPTLFPIWPWVCAKHLMDNSQSCKQSKPQFTQTPIAVIGMPPQNTRFSQQRLFYSKSSPLSMTSLLNTRWQFILQALAYLLNFFVSWGICQQKLGFAANQGSNANTPGIPLAIGKHAPSEK